MRGGRGLSTLEKKVLREMFDSREADFHFARASLATFLLGLSSSSCGGPFSTNFAYLFSNALKGMPVSRYIINKRFPAKTANAPPACRI